MVVLTDRVFFCVVLHAIGVAQLAFASLTSQAKDARKYLGKSTLQTGFGMPNPQNLALGVELMVHPAN
ncbi:hypothetical protein PGTUg99_013355 [Puccinia graminis f. sp. tritici]|uniref:Uncharacterized protein n=1 Tax=Puccinia graminis f. sp. tritici TaxID=56615 RepID=A0A5B0Q348_PUCGR|nr:hypothetical protein PGTUg99_013355 [Puccinia graminis f. sp. tritici]